MRLTRTVNSLIAASLLAASVLLPLFCTGNSQRSAPANYDEAKVGDYTLPDPLITNDGRRVNNPRQWRQRREEILRLFETQVYGRTPRPAPRIEFGETGRDEKALGGLATRREISIYLTGKKDGLQMQLLLYLPNHKTQPAPVFLGLNFNGNHGVHK